MEKSARTRNIPLPERIRPKTLKEFVGQAKLVGRQGVITKLLAGARVGGLFPSLILWGPPGSGKTTLARIIASELKRPFFEFSAVNSSVKDIEEVIGMPLKGKRDRRAIRGRHQTDLLLSLAARKRTEKNVKPPVIFLDEIHRFNKAQQDALLPHVEKGTITLIGATTENPSFEVIGPLLSRCRVLILNQLSEKALLHIVFTGTKELSVKIEEKAKQFLVRSANGDARVALNVLEIANSLDPRAESLSLKLLEQALQRRQLSFDLKGEEFYNTISALHKSIRGSDPNAALYYLARMLEAGQDPLYIARRLLRAAAEDIGLADPNALLIANAAFEACDKIGMPECNVILAEAAVYLAKAPKSNKLYMAYGEAAKDVHEHGNLPVPLHIRNAPTKLMKAIGYGKNYDYFHSPVGEKKTSITYLPDKLKGKRYLKV